MGIRNLNALKPWDQPSDAVDEESSEYRSVAVEVSVELMESDIRYDASDIFYSDSEDGDYFFVQLEGYETGVETQVLTDEDDTVHAGYFGVITGNDESVVPLEEVPVGTHIFIEAVLLDDANDVVASYSEDYGFTIELVSTFGAVFTNGTPAHFVTPE